jgi:hypothetical protein
MLEAAEPSSPGQHGRVDQCVEYLPDYSIDSSRVVSIIEE